MKSRLDPAIAWWEGRTRRERVLLGVMAGLLAAVIAWYGVIAPIGAWKAGAAERRAEASADLQSVEADLARLNAAATEAPVGTGEPIEPLLIRTAEAAGLTIDRQQAEADGAQTAWLQAVPAQAVFGWIAQLEQAHGVTVSSITALKSPTGSGLDVQVSFRSAA
jgi:general secretion pathway protein M